MIRREAITDVGRVVGDAKDANDAETRASKPSLQMKEGGRVSFSLFEGMYYFSPATLIFLAFLTYVFEWDDVTDPEHLAAARRNPAPFLAASCLGFFVNLASLAVISTRGAWLKIVSQLKNVVVICAAVVDVRRRGLRAGAGGVRDRDLRVRHVPGRQKPRRRVCRGGGGGARRRVPIRRRRRRVGDDEIRATATEQLNARR